MLHQPFYYAKPKQPGEVPSYHGIPVFSWQDGYFKSHIVPDLIFVSQYVPEVPRLSAVQHEALDVLMKTASDSALTLSLRLAPGELLLLNNHIVWHGRDAYEDAAGSVRHLLRLWLSVPDSLPAPSAARALVRQHQGRGPARRLLAREAGRARAGCGEPCEV